MSGSAIGRPGQGTLRAIPPWAFALFSITTALAYSPGIVHPAAIHGNYEAIADRTHGLFHSDTERMFEFGRPICAFLTNLPLLVLDQVSDLWMTRAFSLLTVWGLGALFIGICIRHLRIDPLVAAVVGACVFLVPGFSYSILEPAAWAPHLIGILISFVAFERLGRSNIQSLSLLALGKRDIGGFVRQVFRYAGTPNVRLAGLIYLLAFYDYPPAALILALFPAVTMLLAPLPWRFRALFALRDMGFIGAVTLLYLGSVKLLYLPIVRLFAQPEAYDPVFASKVGNTYAFTLQAHVDVVAARLLQMLRVAADLWFLPQLHVHWAVAALLAGALAVAVAASLGDPGRPVWRNLLSRIAVVGACIMLAASPILFAIGGFVTYRTVAVTTSIVVLVVLACAASVVRSLWMLIGGAATPANRAAAAALLAVLAAAVVGTAYANQLTMKLADNEHTYFKKRVEEALDRKAGTLVWLDKRPLFLSEDVPEAHDRKGTWIPPYELACFASYCISSQAIVRAILQELGKSTAAFRIWTPRGDPTAEGITCAMMTESSGYPPKAGPRVKQWMDGYRSVGPISCFDYDLEWRVAR